MKRSTINMPLNITEKHRSKISLLISVVTVAMLCLLLSQLDRILVQIPKQEKAAKAKQEEEQKALATAKPDVYTATFAAVGDNRFSNALIASGQSEEDGSYNYDPVYSQIRETISAADFALVNQETVFTGNSDSFSGEDTFASPTAVGDALVNAGFDGIACATDHMDDFGASMITDTLSYWNNSHPDIKILGIHPSETDAGTITTITINQITIALLDYTGSSYTSSLDTDSNYLIDTLDQTKITEDITKAKAESDCIIVYANWGNEDDTIVSENQKNWAQFFLSQGVLVTIGVNPREVQPMETLTDLSGNSMLVYYSLGNFVSTQSAVPRLLGGLAQFTIEKSVPKDASTPATIQVSTSSLEPLVMHYNHDANEYAVYPLNSYSDELAQRHSIIDNGEDFSVSRLKSLFQEKTGLSSDNTSTLSTVSPTPTDSSSLEDSGLEDSGSEDIDSSETDSYDSDNSYQDDSYQNDTWDNDSSSDDSYSDDSSYDGDDTSDNGNDYSDPPVYDDEGDLDDSSFVTE